jgi:hypothetical protein
MGDLLFIGKLLRSGPEDWARALERQHPARRRSNELHGDLLVTEDLILIGADNGKQGHVNAFERETGKVRGKALAPAGAEGNVGVGSDLLRRGNLIYAVVQGDEVLDLSLKEGSTRWTFASGYAFEMIRITSPYAHGL